MQNNRLYKMVVSALLCAVGILIPLFSPVKIILEPASFTLASHVAIFIAMFLSPATAVFVSLGTAFGFLLAGFPIVVVARAFSHLIFAALGAIWLQKSPNMLQSPKTYIPFALSIGLMHSLCEIMVVMPFYFAGGMTAYYQKGFVVAVLLLVGVGTLVHSMVDFFIALLIYKPLKKVFRS